jgi:hypothetical protein
MYNSNQNQEVVRLILRLRTLEQDYPDRMFTARRDSFVTLVSQYVDAFMRFRRQVMSEYNKNKIPS